MDEILNGVHNEGEAAAQSNTDNLLEMGVDEELDDLDLL